MFLFFNFDFCLIILFESLDTIEFIEELLFLTALRIGLSALSFTGVHVEFKA